jgi:hypothetical protein
MKYIIVILCIIIASSSYAIKVGDVPILNKGVRIGYGIGVSPVGGEVPNTYWYTAYGTDWTVAYGTDWTVTYDTEIP